MPAWEVVKCRNEGVIEAEDWSGALGRLCARWGDERGDLRASARLCENGDIETILDDGRVLRMRRLAAAEAQAWADRPEEELETLELDDPALPTYEIEPVAPSVPHLLTAPEDPAAPGAQPGAVSALHDLDAVLPTAVPVCLVEAEWTEDLEELASAAVAPL